MIELEVQGIPIFAYVVSGLVFGISQCVITSFPFLIPLILDKDHLSISESSRWDRALQFSAPSLFFGSGRIAISILYCFFLLFFGTGFLEIFLDSSSASLILGLTYSLGATICFLYAYKKYSERDTYSNGSSGSTMASGAFMMGILSAAVPCFQSLFIMLSSFSFGKIQNDPLVGILIPLAFVLGTTIPFLILGFLVSFISVYATSYLPSHRFSELQIATSTVTVLAGLVILGSLWQLVFLYY